MTDSDNGSESGLNIGEKLVEMENSATNYLSSVYNRTLGGIMSNGNNNGNGNEDNYNDVDIGDIQLDQEYGEVSDKLDRAVQAIQDSNYGEAMDYLEQMQDEVESLEGQISGDDYLELTRATYGALQEIKSRLDDVIGALQDGDGEIQDFAEAVEDTYNQIQDTSPSDEYQQAVEQNQDFVNHFLGGEGNGEESGENGGDSGENGSNGQNGNGEDENGNNNGNGDSNGDNGNGVNGNNGDQ